LPGAQRQEIRQHADRLLQEAIAYGVFPTPAKAIIAASGLKVSYIQHLTSADCDAPEKVKRAMAKLRGFLHRGERMIYIDKELGTTQRKFVSLHEVAHHWLPDHRATYEILEDSDEELSEDTRDEFERAANCFASDVLFQLDQFTRDARESEFGIGAPVKILSKRYGASNYSTIRRYTLECGRRAGLLICDPSPDSRGVLQARRFVASDDFQRAFGDVDWPYTSAPEIFGPESWFVRNRPLNNFQVPRHWKMKTVSGERVQCTVEAYDSTRQVFFLVYPSGEN